MNLNDTLKNISNIVENDQNLTAELREDVLSLIAEVSVDPTPANLRVLSTVLEKLKDSTKYLSTLKTFSSFELANNAV
jgi:hypothetical protein